MDERTTVKSKWKPKKVKNVREAVEGSHWCVPLRSHKICTPRYKREAI